jgi:hypothetical protein
MFLSSSDAAGPIVQQDERGSGSASGQSDEEVILGASPTTEEAENQAQTEEGNGWTASNDTMVGDLSPTLSRIAD